jgi:hypothetical protein
MPTRKFSEGIGKTNTYENKNSSKTSHMQGALEETRNKISGRVLLRESNVGIPRLLVTAYDANSSTMPSSRTKRPQARADERSRWDRLGSVVTGSEGTFDLAYNYDSRSKASNRRHDLVLVISASEESGAPGQPEPARIATLFRRNAGSVESFRIALDEARLAAAGVSIPRDPSDVEQLIEQGRLAAERQARLDAESRRLFAEKLETRRHFERLAAPKFAQFLHALSTVPPEQHNVPMARYVPPGASVLSANRAIIQAGITGRINKSSRTGIAALSDEVAEQFRDADGNFLTEIPAGLIEQHLGWKTSFAAGMLLRQIPPSLVCRPQPVDPCVEILEGKEPQEPAEEEPPEPEPPSEPGPPDIPLLIGKLVGHMTPPESASIFKVQGRAGVEEVQQRVDGFSLHSGPADAPALHDFHHLQIAFEDVWQELFDDNVVQTGKELYTDLVELGVDPNEYLIDQSELTIKPRKKKKAKEDAEDSNSVPPAVVVKVFDITSEQWHVLYEDQLSDELHDLAVRINTGTPDQFEYAPLKQLLKEKEEATFFFFKEDEIPKVLKDAIRDARLQGERLIRYADHELEAPEKFEQFHHLLEDLEKGTKEPYRFSIYAANRLARSVNFGIVVTYRQKWEPVSYQVGRLVKTVPLAPKEVRRFTKKMSIRQSRAEKEVENNLQARKTESAQTTRAETEIVQKAQHKTNFQMSAEVGGGVGFIHASGRTGASVDAATESQEVKKEFREAVFKAAEEYKSERTTEINVTTGEEISFEESGEISNPNDEIPVTYLFYELERRYKISEQCDSCKGVVLVAQEFPKPNEIDEDWIVANDWILRRVILDDSFVPAMNYLVSKVVGDEVSLQEMYQNLGQQRRIVEELKEELVFMRAQSEGRYAAFQKSIERRAEAVQAEEEGGGIIPMPVGFIPEGSTASPDAARVREEAARDAYERAMKHEKEIFGRLERETTALSTLTETYTKTLSDHLNRKAQISRLRIHIKANIMYYMQAIWSHEPPDQRFFRLHEVPVPKLQGEMTYTLEENPDAIPLQPNWKKPLKLVVKCNLDSDLESQTLQEVADLDNLLGFKGNYMIFPLKEPNALTKFMMTPYLDPIAGLGDPDPLGNWTLSDFVKYACCLHEKLSKEQFERLRAGLEETYRLLVNARGSDGEEIVVPTDSLFIEALPGVHPILEDFKLFHRVVDVKKVQADVRAVEFENLRMAARLLAGEREDPTIEKKMIIEGVPQIAVNPDDN